MVLKTFNNIRIKILLDCLDRLDCTETYSQYLTITISVHKSSTAVRKFQADSELFLDFLIGFSFCTQSDIDYVQNENFEKKFPTKTQLLSKVKTWVDIRI